MTRAAKYSKVEVNEVNWSTSLCLQETENISLTDVVVCFPFFDRLAKTTGTLSIKLEAGCEPVVTEVRSQNLLIVVHLTRSNLASPVCLF